MKPIFLVAALAAAPALAQSYLGPQAITAARDGKTLYVAEADAQRLACVDTASGRLARSISLPGTPTALTLNGDDTRLYVACAAPKSTVVAIDTAAGKIVDTLSAGHTAQALALAPDGKRLYVCNRFNNDVAVIDLAARREMARVPVIREPYAAVLTADGKWLFVANQLPLDRSDSFDVAASVSVIDTASNKAATIRLPNGSSSVRGLCLSPDGRWLYVTHILSHYELPATQAERGWINTNVLSIIDVAGRKLFNTVLLDDVDLGAAMPWSVATSADGRTIFVAHAGTHELSQIDGAALLERLTHLAPAAAAEVPSDLALMATLRKRVQLPGNSPRGLAVVDDRVYVTEYFSDTLAVVDVKAAGVEPVRQIALGPKPKLTQERRGELLFHDATIGFQHWQSCASCHPDGRVDGLNWDLPNDGLGNPKNTRNLLHVFHGGPAMALAVRESATGAVRAGITHILFAVRPEEEAQAMDAYLKALPPVPSPRLVDGKLSPAAEHGKQLFCSAAVGCAQCHPAPYYTDKRSHNVGSLSKYDKAKDLFNTPRLTEAWRTAPYMHDGHYLSIRELLGVGKHGLHGEKARLSARDLDDLAAFVESL
jgi:YVTN family beta-propeller protein